MRNRSAKILATVGPASAAPDTLRLLHDVGVDAFRLNFSHGSHEDHARSVKAIRQVEKDTGNAIAIVADMQGPKLRCGEFENGQIELRYSDTVEIINSTEKGKDGLICMPHPELMAAMEPGHTLKFDDGKLMVTITENDGKTMKARVDVPGILKNKKGINVIGAVLPMSAMTEKDRVDMAFALTQDVDYIALSFVQTAQDVIDAREIIGDKAHIIVKIEKPSAVNCKAVLGYTLTGSTVQRISRERPPCRIVCLTPRKSTASRLALSWGVLPIVMKDPVDFDDMLGSVQDVAVNRAGLKSGDMIMISAGIPFGRPGTTNTLKISTID